MSTFEKISPDDHRLTAYALGEMEAVERAEFERLIQQDAAAQAMVAEIRGAARAIGVALHHEPVPSFAARPHPPAGDSAAHEYDRREHGVTNLLRFPQMYFAISGLAAACFAIGFIVWQAKYLREPGKHYTEVDLTKLLPAEAKKDKGTAGVGAPFELLVRTPSIGGGQRGLSPEKEGRDNGFTAVVSAPVSTFPINTGTAAYANVRQSIEGGHQPACDEVRIEEMVNYFPYSYGPADDVPPAGGTQSGYAAAKNPGAVPFAAYLEVASAPWTPGHRLVRIALQGRAVQNQPGAEGRSVTQPIAEAVKITVEFNPAQVQEYRLIGYENRQPSAEDFTNDKIDAGDVVGGHTVTALYEILPVSEGRSAGIGAADAHKYRQPTGPAEGRQDELLTLTVGYKIPGGDDGEKLTFPLRDNGRSFDEATADFKFAASVAAFGMILRESPHKGEATLAGVTKWAQAGLRNDMGGYRSEFIGLVSLAERLSQN